MKSITPKTSVKPAAIRNKRTPSCKPLRIWTRRSVVDMLHHPCFAGLPDLPLPRFCNLLIAGGNSLPPPSKGEDRWGSAASPLAMSALRIRRCRASHIYSQRAARDPHPNPPPFRGRGQVRAPSGHRSFHRAIFGVGVAVIREHLLDDLGLVFAVGPLGDLGQIEVLYRIVVVVELE